MMRQQPLQQNALFHDFCLEPLIPSNHLLRHIDSFLTYCVGINAANTDFLT